MDDQPSAIVHQVIQGILYLNDNIGAMSETEINPYPANIFILKMSAFMSASYIQVHYHRSKHYEPCH